MRHLPASITRRTWSTLHALLLSEQEALDGLIRQRASEIPVMKSLLDQADAQPEATAERQRRSDELLRGAMLEGDWDAYAQDLAEQGRTYARLGVELSDWYALVDVIRVVLVPRSVERFSGPELVEVLHALDAYVDLAMRQIGEAYVAEKAELAEAARGERDLFHRLFRHCPLGLAIHARGPDGSLPPVTVNEAAERLAGTIPTDASDGGFRREQYEALLGRCLEGGETLEQAFTVGDRTIQVWFVPLDASHVGTIHDDVTEIRQVNRSLRRTVAELERSNRDLDNFAYVASHDLKAPLRDIANLSTWLVEDLGQDLPPDPARHLERLRDRVVRMERLLDDLLQYSRAGRLGGTPERFELRDALASAVALVNRPEGFQIVAPSPSLRLFAARAPFELVLRNLVGNAVKHHDHPERGRIEVTWSERDGMVTVAVADNGPGIPAEYHMRVFELFQTLQPRDRVEGSGMGLAIVRKVVEAAGGTIDIETSSSAGTTFRFTWPREPRALEEGR